MFVSFTAFLLLYELIQQSTVLSITVLSKYPLHTFSIIMFLNDQIKFKLNEQIFFVTSGHKIMKCT